METKELILKVDYLSDVKTLDVDSDLRILGGYYFDLINYIDLLKVEGQLEMLERVSNHLNEQLVKVEKRISKAAVKSEKTFPYKQTEKMLYEVRGNYLDRLIAKIAEVSPALNNTYGTSTPPKTPKYFVRHYALTYLLDCHAQGKSPEAPNNKDKLELIGSRLTEYKKSGNSFYKEYGQIFSFDLNARSTLVKFGGENWREIVLALSDAPQLLDKYLKNKGL